MLADINGDLRANAVAFWGDTGTWRVATAKSTTPFSGFNAATTWRAGHGVGSDRRFLARVDSGNLTADAVRLP